MPSSITCAACSQPVLYGLTLLLHLTIAPADAGRIRGFALLLAFVTAWQLLARLVSYMTLERHLPP